MATRSDREALRRDWARAASSFFSLEASSRSHFLRRLEFSSSSFAHVFASLVASALISSHPSEIIPETEAKRCALEGWKKSAAHSMSKSSRRHSILRPLGLVPAGRLYSHKMDALPKE